MSSTRDTDQSSSDSRSHDLAAQHGDIKLVDEDSSNTSTTSQWAPAEVSEIDLYKKREKIYTRKIEGFFQRVRLYTGWPLLLGYFFVPWLSIPTAEGEWRQAVLFNLVERKFHLLWFTVWPQDLSILGLILIIAAFALFLVTTLAGRVWCGYTCPQTVWTAIFTWIEQKFEGTRNQRIKLDKQPWSLTKARKKITKHIAWLGFAFLTGFTFIGYFAPIRELSLSLLTFELPIIAVAWIVFFTLATYINAGWMREQVCLYMCPYARFQSAMFDRNTLIVSYDPYRGEPRGARKRGIELADTDMGACVDCQMCAQVCPTGIDIRDGLQYQCITCALCIDACNAVMDKMDYPRGLIRYTTENLLDAERDSTGSRIGKLPLKSVFMRTKVIAYCAVLVVVLGLVGLRLGGIEPVEISVLPDRHALAAHLSDGSTENRFLLRIANKRERTIAANISLDTEARVNNQNFELAYLGPQTIEIASGEVMTIRFKVRAQGEGVQDSASRVPVLPFAVNIEVEGKQYIEESRMVIHQR